MKDSILNIEVSCFKHYKSHDHHSVNLLQWLQSTKYKKEVDAIRQIESKTDRDELKAKLPAITPSGLFSQRNAEGLIKHSGFIAIDIDFKDNKQIDNYVDLKNELKKIKHIAYVGLSVSGNGYWALIPIADSGKHKECVEFLVLQFKQYGIILDSACKDVCRLRGYSYDKGAYFNHNAIVFILPTNYTSSIKKHQQGRNLTQYQNSTDSLELLIREMQQRNIDITANYDDWGKIGFALASEYGEAGRTYFHSISNVSTMYDYDECEREYTKILKNNKGNISIATIYYQCKIHGLKIKKL